MKDRRGGNLSGGSSSNWRAPCFGDEANCFCWTTDEGIRLDHQGDGAYAEAHSRRRGLSIVVSEPVLSFALDIPTGTGDRERRDRAR